MSEENKSIADEVNPNYEIPDDITQPIWLFSYIITSPTISIFGIVANTINIMIYYRHGLSESVNITFFTLAVSDIMALIFCLWYGIGMNPWLTTKKDLPFDSKDVTYITGAFPRLMFSKMTCLITVYITVERCFCIMAPLQVKTLLTPKKTLLILAILFILCLVTNFPLIYLGVLSLFWITDLVNNHTYLAMDVRADYFDVNFFCSWISTISFLISFGVLIVATVILIIGLHKKASILKCLAANSIQSLSKRDTTLSKTIVLLSVALIGCYLPYTVNCIITPFLEGFMFGGKYNNFFLVMWSFSWLFETLNSTTSILIFYKMSSKYRETFKLLLRLSRHSAGTMVRKY